LAAAVNIQRVKLPESLYPDRIDLIALPRFLRLTLLQFYKTVPLIKFESLADVLSASQGALPPSKKAG
jgi:hypothetical protein